MRYRWDREKDESRRGASAVELIVILMTILPISTCVSNGAETQFNSSAPPFKTSFFNRAREMNRLFNRLDNRRNAPMMGRELDKKIFKLARPPWKGCPLSHEIGLRVMI